MADASDSTSKQCTLPREKVFSIQIGSDLFRLSGASIASDAPSYFSRFFEEQMRNPDSPNIRTLYIDRDPETFKEIARHLQGYYVRPRDGAQFVKLFADSQFYCLPRLMSQLFESEIFIQIGDRHFQIPRDIFSSPGDSPNFFTLGFGAFFASPSEVFPGLDRVGLLRPPAITPPSVPNRSAEIFAELLHLLRGYPLHIRNADHRAELLRDCKYFHLRGLEQKLIPHDISVNPFNQRSEIALRLEDVRPSGIQVATNSITSLAMGGLVMYARPFVDDKPFDLMLEIGGESTIISRAGQRADFIGQTKSRMASLVQVIGKKMNVPETHVAGLPLNIRWGRETDLTIDGERDPQRIANLLSSGESDEEPPAKRQRSEGSEEGPWVVRKGQWRLLVQQADPSGPCEVVLIAAKLDVYTHPRIRNRARDFL
ncbi:uncharacterized protein N7484_004823 [Penicillium longicatenatum]|uniref:uncharacterized protein n=1 Tax=Penicillium longicatenatum TaxID=1561947 RepID=UPI002546E66E|nr:uncharacterized protein N7484_004823 [Penicillium longicatenatum]KAJ5651100.1 hypothetical protein N7484_004823 [Penicillium longicatenatum]